MTYRSKTWKIVVVTSLIWILGLSSCAGLKIKTWFLSSKTDGALVRKDSHGQIMESLNYIQADGYRCYSEQDDTAWRNRLVLCCNGVKKSEARD
jgi:hypothetical protein